MPIPRPSADAAAARLRYATRADLDTLLNRQRQYPAPGKLWSTDRPDIGFGAGDDLAWSFTGDGTTTSFPIPGRLSTAASRYRVTVGGAGQTPRAFSLPADSETLVFTEPPPAGLRVYVCAPFYGAAP